MAKRKSIFTQEQGKQVTLSTKVPEDIKKRIDNINSTLSSIAPDKKFNVSSIMSAAILEAVEIAESELSDMKNQTSSNDQ